ncbi:hypothetical protein [Corynebacterium heidelbergense]|uniref:hypothetical protein n=1 Tax=Corynebacterium heidelbergense TaxID=2055947 RepID=UPI0011BEA547|nr:hypothetical protein [Corynebacterium heidelbergense]
MDDFNRSSLGSGYSGSGIDTVNSAFVRVTAGSGRWTRWTTADVAQGDDWVAETVIYDLPDPVQESGIMIGSAESDCVAVMFCPNTLYLGYWKGNAFTELQRLDKPWLKAGSTVRMSRSGQLVTVDIDGSRAASGLIPAAWLQGSGTRKLFLRLNMYRGWLGPSYYSPGLDLLRAR